jgi:hypothetical protein
MSDDLVLTRDDSNWTPLFLIAYEGTRCSTSVLILLEDPVAVRILGLTTTTTWMLMIDRNFRGQ